jgi:ATP-binding cassette subfamily G (WHITE) protein 2 (PDR)
MLFERFDRLLFLAKGGRPVYFGEIGKRSHILVDYFVRNGSEPIPEGANPAEWIFTTVGAAPGSHTDVDWVDTWNNSPEKVAVHAELQRIREIGDRMTATTVITHDASYAAPFWEQMRECYVRIMQQYWRTPSYILSKFLLTSITSLFVGFSFFKAGTSIQGLQNQLYSVFMVS